MSPHTLHLTDEGAEVAVAALWHFVSLSDDEIYEREIEPLWHVRAAAIAEALAKRLPIAIAEAA